MKQNNKQKQRPAISVVMSAYNSEKYIAEAIESILNQTFKDFEFIIINDGSTDKTLEIIKNYSRKDKRIKLIKNTKNLGLIKSLNKGLKAARGKYIARMDADDISLPERFKIQYDYLEKNIEIFLIGSGVIQIDKKGKEILKSRPITGVKKIKRILRKRNCIAHPTIMFQNDQNIFYREKMLYCEDYDLYLRLLHKKNKLDNIKELLLKYRISPDSITNSKRAIQDLFVEEAKKFYRESEKSNRESYEDFNPNWILKIKIEESLEKNILASQIKASFKINDFIKCREYCKKYFNSQGYLNKFIIYYISTFLGKNMVDRIRKRIF